MHFPLPELPHIDWFEMEILYFLEEKEMYGNEMLAILNDHLGEGEVSSGKLYSDLKKMEKKGTIKRIRRKRKKGEGLMTRGVDRVYFEITPGGREELKKAETYMRSWQFISMLKRTTANIRMVLENEISSMENNITVGVAVNSKRMEVKRTMDLLPDNEGLKYVLLLISPLGDLMSIPFLDKEGKDMATFPSKVDDIPLKSNYLDAVISTYPLSGLVKRQKLLKELVRVVKIDGRVMIVDLCRLKSYMLEDIVKSNMEDLKGEIGIDEKEMKSLMREHLGDVELDRFKEFFIARGTK